MVLCGRELKKTELENWDCSGILDNDPHRVQETLEDQRTLLVMRMNYPLLCLVKSKITVYEEVEKYGS